MEDLVASSNSCNPFYPEIPKALNKDLKYLVVDPKYGLHSWRFSINTTLALQSFGADVTYCALRNLDPEKFLLRLRILIRPLWIKKERHKFGNEVLDKYKVKRIKLNSIPSPRIHKDALNLLLGRRNVINSSLDLALNSFFAARFGSTRFKDTLWIRILAVRVASKYHRAYITLKKNRIHENFDCIFTFNGRFPIDSAISQYCKDHGLDRILFDGGSISQDNYNRIQFFETSPHNPTEIKQKVSNYWMRVDNSKIETAKDSINSLMAGNRSLGSSFNWESGINPVKSTLSALSLHKSIVFFASSDWEQAAINEWRVNKGFSDQFAMLEALNLAALKFDLQILIKPHPIRKNYRINANVNERMLWENFCSSNKISARILSEGDNVQTQDLLRASRIVAGFGTSVLAQAIYCGIPTIVGTREPWINDRNELCLAESPEAISTRLRRILNLSDSAPDPESVLPWAYYQTMNGIVLSGLEFSGREIMYEGKLIDRGSQWFLSKKLMKSGI
jgi:hypothetical protein